MTIAELRQELQTELDRLFDRVQAGREGGQDQNEIEQATNTFELDWYERLTREQEAKISGAQIGAEQMKAIEERNREAQRQADERDARQLPEMTRDDQVAYWQSNRTGDGIYKEQQRAQDIKEAVEQAQKQITAEYNDLRYDLGKAVQQVERGQQPTLTQTLVKAVEQETWEEYQARQTKEKQTQEQIEQEQNRQREQELERVRELGGR